MAKDIYHQTVREALIKDGWTITHDPFLLTDKSTNMDYDIDLGAEKLITAERGTEKIAIEVKSFLKASFTHEFHGVFGQYIMYFEGLKIADPERVLYLAMPDFAYEKLNDYSFIKEVIMNYQMKLIVFDSNVQTIITWIK